MVTKIQFFHGLVFLAVAGLLPHAENKTLSVVCVAVSLGLFAWTTLRKERP